MKPESSCLNFRVIIPVALMSLASLVLAFVSTNRMPKGADNYADTIHLSSLPDGASPNVVDSSEILADIAYYEQLAEEFISMLPTDKRVLASLIDVDNHHIIYYETTESPSCYCYNLETQNTSVLFGGERGFYIDTKLLILGKIIDCRVLNVSRSAECEPKAVFIASNNAPEVATNSTDRQNKSPEIFENAVHVFELNLVDHSLRFISSGASAYFPNDSQLVVNHAKLLYRSLFTNEDVYTTAPTTYDL